MSLAKLSATEAACLVGTTKKLAIAADVEIQDRRDVATPALDI
jgi:hypothetical protein